MPTRQILIYNEKKRAFEDRTPKRLYSDDVHMVMPDTQGCISPVSGEWIEGRVQRREDLKRNNCREVDPSEKKYFMQQDFKNNVDLGLDDPELNRELNYLADNPKACEDRQRHRGEKLEIWS